MLSEIYLGKNGVTLFTDVVNNGKPNSYLFRNMLEDNTKNVINDSVERMLEMLQEEGLLDEIFNDNFITDADVHTGGGMVGGMRVTELMFTVIVALQATLALAASPEPQRPAARNCGGLLYGKKQQCVEEEKEVDKLFGIAHALWEDDVATENAAAKKAAAAKQKVLDDAEAAAAKQKVLDDAAAATRLAEMREAEAKSNEATARAKKSEAELLLEEGYNRNATSGLWWKNLGINIAGMAGITTLMVVAYSAFGNRVRIWNTAQNALQLTNQSSELVGRSGRSGFVSGRVTSDTKKTFKSFCVDVGGKYININPEYYEYYASRTNVFYKCEENDDVAVADNLEFIEKILTIPKVFRDNFRDQKTPNKPLQVDHGNAIGEFRESPRKRQQRGFHVPPDNDYVTPYQQGPYQGQYQEQQEQQGQYPMQGQYQDPRGQYPMQGQYQDPRGQYPMQGQYQEQMQGPDANQYLKELQRDVEEETRRRQREYLQRPYRSSRLGGGTKRQKKRRYTKRR